MLTSFGNLLGLLFGIGLAVLMKPLTMYALNYKQVSRFKDRFMRDVDFAFKTVVSIVSGATSSLFLGAWSKNPLVAVLALFIGTFIGLKIAESNLKSRVTEYDLRLRISSGAFLDVIGICVTSGLPIRTAISQSCIKSTNEIQSIWSPLTSDTGAELPFVKHLSEVAASNNSNVMSRIARTLLVSHERGTPVSRTLQSLSSEIRSETRRQLLEIAAKKDVTMMVPVVFGILPSITAIALYPAFISLSIM